MSFFVLKNFGISKNKPIFAAALREKLNQTLEPIAKNQDQEIEF